MSRSLHTLAGQLVIVGFDGPAPSDDLRSLAREFDLGGVILFGRNVEAPGQIEALCRELRELARELPLWISVDQEGGRVARLRAPFTEWPPMAALGRSGDVELARRFARVMAAELLAAGINLDWAPVLDVHTNPANPVIGDRALSEDPEQVARLGVAIVETMQACGLAACGKHFPGHGDTSVDSHHDLPLVEHDLRRLRAVELVPFRAAIAADVAFIMTAHVLAPALDGDRPATLSPRVVGGLLREELGFEGVVVSDDLEMKAISARWSLADATVAALGAGCDAVLLCGTGQAAQAAAIEAIIRAVEDGTLDGRRVETSLTRLRRAKERFLAGPAPEPRAGRLRAIGGEAHRRVADEMARFV